MLGMHYISWPVVMPGVKELRKTMRNLPDCLKKLLFACSINVNARRNFWNSVNKDYSNGKGIRDSI